MSPKEYNQMVEHLASEIVDSAFEKEATARKGRIENYLEAYRQGEANKKLFHANMDMSDARQRLADANEKKKVAKISHDGKGVSDANKERREAKRVARKAAITRANPITNWQARMERESNGNWLPGFGKRQDRISAQNTALQEYMAERSKKSQKTAEEMIVDFAFEKEAGIKDVAGKVMDTVSKPVESFGKYIHGKNVTKGVGPAGITDAKAYKAGKRGAAVGRYIQEHAKGITGTIAGTAALTGAGIAAAAAAKRKKAKKEEAQEKAAAYYDDAIMWKEAATNVWAYADELGEDYADEAVLLKNAAEEVFDEASAQEEAAVNVYNDIEDAFADDADYEEEDFAEDDEA